MSIARRNKLFKKLSMPIYEETTSLGGKNAACGEVEITSSWKIIHSEKASLQVMMAVDDLKSFFKQKAQMDIESDSSQDKQKSITLKHAETEHKISEAYGIHITENNIIIEGHDDSGIMYGVFYLEEQMKINNAPVLKKGTINRKPLLKTRILRSPMAFYYAEELLDIDNAYPETYLNKMAHHGINGIWLRGILRDLVKTQVFPELGQNSEKLLAQLRRLIERCAKYGIKIFLYFTEPLAFEENHDFFENYPHLRGEYWEPESANALCTSNNAVKEYLKQGMYELFSKAKGLGGVILITASEHHSHCYSHVHILANGDEVTCEKCRERSPQDVIAEVISLINTGVKSADPIAKVIAWNWSWSMYETDPQKGFIEKMPRDVILMGDFERGGIKFTDGHKSLVDEYCLSWVGPSERCKGVRDLALQSGHEFYAKLQIVTTHELATVPDLPILYNVGEKMIRLIESGATGAMLCWNFGNFLSYNTEICNWFSWAPRPESIDDVLTIIAKRDFGIEAASGMLEAWKHFNKSMEHYPFDAQFATEGMHNFGPAYPFSLEKINKPLACNWLLPGEIEYNAVYGCSENTGYGDSLDMLCLQFPLEKSIKSMKLMLIEWQKGIQSMLNVKAYVPKDLQHNFIREYNVASAFLVQYTSAVNFIEFVLIRDKMHDETNIAKKKNMLQKLKKIAVGEIRNAQKGKILSEKELALGFHGEAFGFMYTPEKIENKIMKMQYLVNKEIPAYETKIKEFEEIEV